MKTIRTEDAAGHVLCHDLTRIVRGVSKGVAFKRGHIITEEDIPELLKIGKEQIYVYEKSPGILHENEAAQILYSMAAGEYMYGSEVKEGKIDIFAERDGLFTVDVERLRELNSFEYLMIATRHTNSPVKKGDALAGTRIIPLVIEEKIMNEVQSLMGEKPLLQLHPFRPRKAAIVVTGSEIKKGLIKDTFTPVVEAKLAAFGITDVPHVFVGDDSERTSAAIREYLAEGYELILCTGGMSVDPDDRTPLAIRNAADRVVRYGSPVLPGAMFMLAYAADGQAIMGLPGCVMYHGITILDVILPRILADIEVSSADIAALGHGGLCLNCKVCHYPACAVGSGI